MKNRGNGWGVDDNNNNNNNGNPGGERERENSARGPMSKRAIPPVQSEEAGPLQGGPSLLVSRGREWRAR